MRRFEKRIDPTGAAKGYSGAKIFESDQGWFYVWVSSGSETNHPCRAMGLYVSIAVGRVLTLDAIVYDTAPDVYARISALTEAGDARGLYRAVVGLFTDETGEIWEAAFKAGVEEGRRQLQTELQTLLGCPE